MSNMLTLGNIATFINGHAFKPTDWGTSGLPIIRIQNLTGSSNEINYYSGEYPKRVEINDNDVLISWSASLGIYVWYGGKALLNQHIFKVVFDKIEIDKKYFFFALQEKIEEMITKTHGATMKHIIKSDFENIKIEVPSLLVQQKIATILDKLCKQIENRKKQLLKIDELIKARFIEMFGDPATNPKRWNTQSWQELFDTTTGKLDSNAMTDNGQYPFFTCAKEAFRINSYAFDCEALMLAGNNAAGIYDVKYYKGKFNAYQRTYVITLKDKANSYLIFKIMLEQKLLRMQELSKGTNTRYLTLGILHDFSFIVPPIPLQNQFANFVQEVEKTKTKVQTSLTQLETLYNALMQKYFG